MTRPSLESKAIAKAAMAAFGGSASVARYWDDRRELSVDIVCCRDSPSEGVVSRATVGVWETPLLEEGKEVGVRAELVGACGSRFDMFANCLATAAFLVMNSRCFVAPGIILPDVLAMYDVSSTMKHFLLLPPFLWGGRLSAFAVGTKQVAWLLTVPISDAELSLAEQKGVPQLETLFEQRQIDIFDLERPSVV